MREFVLSLMMGLAIPIAAAAQLPNARPAPSARQVAPSPRAAPSRQVPAPQPPAPPGQAPGAANRSTTDTAGPASNAPDAPPTFYTRQRSFRLPISILQAPFRIVSIQLHVSTDQGRTWRLYDQQPADAKHFVFETQQDGEVWFASKTVDERNTIRPGGPTRPEQRVVIDSTPPQLEFNATIGPQGDLQVTWHAHDAWLDPQSLRLEYQTSITEPFREVTIPAHAVVAEQGGVSGKWQWSLAEPTRVAHVRMEVLDRAGNRTANVQRVYLPRVAASPGATSTQVSSGPDAPAADSLATQSGPATIPWPSSNQVPPEHVAVTPENRAWTAASRTAPESRSRPEQPAPGDKVAANGKTAPGKASVDNSQVSDDGNQPPATAGPGRFAAMSTTPLNDVSSPVPGQFHPSVASKVPVDELDVPPQMSTDSSDSGRSRPASAWPAVPENQPVRMTTARRFHLDYDVESTRPHGIRDIELWATQDGGRTWERWGSDPDKESPFDVQVEHDGLYGFRVVVIAENGLASDPPYSGSPADLWVGVDNEPPTAEITAVLYGTGARMGELDIRWQADDQRLLDRPITLSFSDKPQGPWTIIAAGLPNTGQYYWRVDRSVPRQVYLRLQVADEAGNASEYTIREPINTEGLLPKGRIHSLIPVK